MKKQTLFYITIYTLSCTFALISLYFNTQTVPLIKKTDNLRKKNAVLQLENQYLKNKIATEKSIQNIHKKAKQLNMILPKPNKVTHVKYKKRS